MDNSILFNQLNLFKSNLIANINNELNKYKDKLIYFTKTYYYVDPLNPDKMISIYGFENGKIKYDSYVQIINAVEFNTLPLEFLLFFKEELQNHKNALVISGEIIPENQSNNETFLNT